MNKYRGAISRKEFERIERYVLGAMDDAERVEFEQALRADETLRHEVELQRMLMGAVELGTFNPHGKIHKKSLHYVWYAAAAVLMVGLALGGWWFYSPQKVRMDDLYSTYFRSDPGLPVVMGSDSLRYLFNEGMVSYKEGNYSDATGVWERLAAENGVSDTLHYYIGMAYLNSERYVDASGHLVSVADDRQSVFREKAIWYLALVRLKDKDYARAKRLLMKLPENETAKELISQITD